MAVYNNGKMNLNNMERSSAGMTKHIGAEMVSAPLVAGDVVVLGALPRESVTTDMRVLVNEAFDGGGFELGYYDFNSGTFVVFSTIILAAIDEADKAIVLAMPVNGQINPDDTIYAGDRGGIWNGDVETVIAMRWTGATPTTGRATFVTTHTYFGTKDGSYGSDYVPLTVYGEGKS